MIEFIRTRNSLSAYWKNWSFVFYWSNVHLCLLRLNIMSREIYDFSEDNDVYVYVFDIGFLAFSISLGYKE